jgi:hypothetical protein
MGLLKKPVDSVPSGADGHVQEIRWRKRSWSEIFAIANNLGNRIRDTVGSDSSAIGVRVGPAVVDVVWHRGTVSVACLEGPIAGEFVVD